MRKMKNGINLHELITQIKSFYFSNKRMAFYVAAGISKDCPTHLPLVRELTRSLTSGFFETEIIKDLSPLRKAAHNRTLEEVCRVIQYELKDKTQLTTKMAKALDGDEIIPNHNHSFLARALHDGHIVVTTNFESLVERAYFNLYKTEFPKNRICYDEETFEQFQQQSLNFNRVDDELGWLLKLHGTFHVHGKNLSHSIITTLDRIGQGLPPAMRKVLIKVLINCPLVVLGYGCMDIDIVYPVMIRTSSLQPIWWVKHDDQRTCIYNKHQIEKIIKNEETKSVVNRSLPVYNVAKLLYTRAKHNGKNEVWQINTHTSLLILAMMSQFGGKYEGHKKPCTGRIKSWKNQLYQLGVEASPFEKILVLAKLAQICSPNEPNSQEIYKLSTELFQFALGETQDYIQKAHIYREIGWNKYRQDPEKNIDHAVDLYDKAIELLKKDDKGWVLRVEILGLRTLAFRRSSRIVDAMNAAQRTWESLPSFIRSVNLPSKPQVLGNLLKKMGVEKNNFESLGSTLRRVVALYDQCVSGPDALATSIQYKYLWKMDKQEIGLLKRAEGLLKTDLLIQKLAGELLQTIQLENHLGLIYSKLGQGKKAKTIHNKSILTATMLGHSYECAQALRNRALAEEVKGELNNAISSLKEAIKLFEGHSANVLISLWHLGRIRIKHKDEKGIEDIKKHLAENDDWHWKANDHALLGIAYFDIKGDYAKARQQFSLMIKQYPKKNNVLDTQTIRNRTYGVDNALANTMAAIERFNTDNSTESVQLCRNLSSLQLELENIRTNSIKSLSF